MCTAVVPEGRAHRESDLDLAVLLDWVVYPDRPSRAERQVELISDLIASTGKNEIDLVMLNDTPRCSAATSCALDFGCTCRMLNSPKCTSGSTSLLNAWGLWSLCPSQWWRAGQDRAVLSP
jgi:hypothetical protein